MTKNNQNMIEIEDALEKSMRKIIHLLLYFLRKYKNCSAF